MEQRGGGQELMWAGDCGGSSTEMICANLPAAGVNWSH